MSNGKSYLIEKMFEGHQDPLSRVLVQKDDGTSPDGVTSAPKGTFLVVCYVGDATDGDCYINTDGSTAWTQINDETA